MVAGWGKGAGGGKRTAEAGPRGETQFDDNNVNVNARTPIRTGGGAAENRQQTQKVVTQGPSRRRHRG